MSAAGDAAGVPALSQLFGPRSVALVGASATPGKWGYEYSRQLLAGRHRRSVYLVNAKGEPVLGQRTFRSLLELPEVPELVVVCVPAERAAAVVAEGLSLGAALYVCVAGGFAELGEAGRRQEQAIVAALRSKGARMVGPNCVGLFDAAAVLHCTAFWDLPAGEIGMISQSGGAIIELGLRLQRIGLGISRAVSVGNQADLTVADFVESFADDPNTRLTVAYIEEFRDGRRLFRAIERARGAGKEVVLLSPQQDAATVRAAASHTGSLVASDDAVESIAADVGVVRVRSFKDLMLAIRGLAAPRRSAGRRVGVVADGGGLATLGAGAVVAAGLEVPAFSEDLQRRLAAAVAAGSAVGNPVDVVGALDLEVFLPVTEAIARSGEVDAILLNGAFNNVSGRGSASQAEGARRLRTAMEAAGKALAVAAMLPEEPAMQALAAARVPVLDYPDEAARCLDLGRHRSARRAMPAESRVGSFAGRTDYFGARSALAAYGIAFNAAREVQSLDQALIAAAELGYPVVLKSLGASHKADAGGVALGLTSETLVRRHFEDMVARLDPPTFSVEAMVRHPGSVELLIGGLSDRSFGAQIAIAAGGTLTELLRDRRVALAPVDEAYAETMLMDLRVAPLLLGHRGRPPADVPALVKAVVAISRFIADHPQVAEVEVNPIIAHANGAVAVDARLILAMAG